MVKRVLSCLIISAILISLPASAASVSLISAETGGFGQFRSTAAAGYNHTIALAEDGSVFTWGDNTQGQLGVPDIKASSVPVKIDKLTAISVAAGSYFSAVLTEEGRVYWWGNGDTKRTLTGGANTIVQISANNETILALDRNGDVYSANAGQEFKKLPNIKNAAVISAGGKFSLALDQSGVVWQWSPGGTPFRAYLSSPNGHVTAIAAGSEHGLAVLSSGEVCAWGDNTSGQLGETDGDTGIGFSNRIPGIHSAVSVAAGYKTSAVITYDGKVHTLGYNEYGQLGANSQTLSSKTPERVYFPAQPTAVFISDIVFGQNHALAISRNGDIFTWGRDNAGQLGLNQNTSYRAPVLIPSLKWAGPAPFSTDIFAGAAAWAVNGSEKPFMYEDGLSAFWDSGIAPIHVFSRFTDNITRDEFAYVLVTLYNQIERSTVPGTGNSFADIGDSIYQDEIAQAYSLGFITGRTEKVFAPSDPLSRQEAAVMLVRFINKLNDNTDTPIISSEEVSRIYKDAGSLGKWAYAAVVALYKDSIMIGSDKRFNPLQWISRQEVLLITRRAIVSNGYVPFSG